MRPTWDETWMIVAETLAKRSTCVNRKVGCIIVDRNNRPISGGYNGPPAKLGHGGSYTALRDGEDCTAFCPRSNSEKRTSDYDNCVSVHAEMNALMFADRRDYYGGTIYVTSPCCYGCAKAVANSGVKRVVVKLEEKDEHADNRKGIDLLIDCKVEVVVL